MQKAKFERVAGISGWMMIIMDISHFYDESYGPMNLVDCTYMIKGLN